MVLPAADYHRAQPVRKKPVKKLLGAALNLVRNSYVQCGDIAQTDKLAAAQHRRAANPDAVTAVKCDKPLAYLVFVAVNGVPAKLAEALLNIPGRERLRADRKPVRTRYQHRLPPRAQPQLNNGVRLNTRGNFNEPGSRFQRNNAVCLRNRANHSPTPVCLILDYMLVFFGLVQNTLYGW